MSRTVLIVDDSEVLRHALKLLLTRYADVGLFQEASNGAEAIEKAEADQPEMIILDLAMPVMNGLEAAPILKRVAPRSHILLLTMYDFVVPLQRNGIDAVLSKVTDLGRLADHVRAVLK